jgi:hypothetical protein
MKQDNIVLCMETLFCMKLATVTGLVFFSFSTLLAQKTVIQFDVLHNGKNIGLLTATKEVNGAYVTKTISSNTSTKVLLLNLHVESEIKVSTHKEILLNLYAYRNVNHGHDNTKTKVVRLAANRYKVTKNGKEKIATRPEIRFCVSDLYFKEPVGLGKVFSDTFAEDLKLEINNPNTYQLILPDGNKSTYSYTNGVLKTVVSDFSVGEVVFNRK